jgi:hypothetical protein
MHKDLLYEPINVPDDFHFVNLSHQVNEDLLVIQHVLKNRHGEASLADRDKTSAQALYAWLAQISLPSSEFASALEACYSANGK